MNPLRWIVAGAVLASYFATALAHEEPGMMLIGLFPLAWLAIEAVWRMFGS